MGEYFGNIGKIQYEGKNSDNPLAFKFYNPDEMVGSKKMKEHLRFAMSWWHTITGEGRDMFGEGSVSRPYGRGGDPIIAAKEKIDAGFEFMEKLGIDFYCFHDRDVSPEADSLAQTNRNFDEIAAYLKEKQEQTGKKLLWGTANLFSNPRYVHGAATSCNPDVFAFAAAQVKKAIEVTVMLGGESYVLWGGREGYETLLNTDMKLELDNLARFLHMAVDYARSIGFTGKFMIEPKPKEPTKHQYDFDTATVAGFLRKYDLIDDFCVNIEANHATLAGHTLQHELRTAHVNGIFGSVDANMGDLLLGWDTDQFPTDLYDTTLAMYEIMKAGGFTFGGLNFDSKIRRASFEPEDLFLAYIAGMDAFAAGLKIAHKLIDHNVIDGFIHNRYEGWRTGIGADIVAGRADFVSLEQYALSNHRIVNKSGRQEHLESTINRYMLSL